MYFGKQFWQSLACFVIGGIITVIFIKILEWQRDENNEEQRDEGILVPVQEVEEEEVQEEEEPLVHIIRCKFLCRFIDLLTAAFPLMIITLRHMK